MAMNASNHHGGHYFMSLYSGKRVHSYNWKELPIDDDVNDRVEELASKEGATEMQRGYPTFVWKQRELDMMDLNETDAVEDFIPIDNINDEGAKQGIVVGTNEDDK